MNNFVTVWCEWDIGQHGLIFANAHVAERWLRNNMCLKSMAEEEERLFDDFYQELVDNVLVGIDDVELIQ